MLKLDKKYCLNTDKTAVVDCTSADAHWVLGAAGAVISEKDAERLGLSGLETADNVGIGNPKAMELPVSSDKLYSDQTEAGKKARVDSRAAMGNPSVEESEEETEEETTEENKSARSGNVVRRSR